MTLARSRVLALICCLLAPLVACSGEGGGGGPTTPDTRSLSLSAAPTSIGVGEESLLTAVARNASGAALAGAIVSFSTQLGQLDAPSRITDGEGRALVRLRGAGQSGTASVTARIEGTSISATVSVRIGIGSRVTLVVAPNSIPVNGGAARLDAQVERLDGLPTPAGTVVQIAATLGRLEDAQPRTDAFGVARTRLLADGRTGTARISATTAGAEIPAEAEVVIGQGLQVSLRAAPARIPAAGSTTLTVLVSTATGGAPPSGTSIELATTLGRLDASRLSTNSTGTATTTLRGEGVRGTARVTATVAGAAPATLDVPFD